MKSSLENYTGIKIAKLRNSIKNQMEIALTNYNISTTQFVVLLKLCEKDKMTQKELAKETNYKESALTLILDKLEKKGLVTRESKENDRRAYLVKITQDGEDLGEKLSLVAQEQENMIFEGIKLEQKKEFFDVLEKIYFNMNKDNK